MVLIYPCLSPSDMQTQAHSLLFCHRMCVYESVYMWESDTKASGETSLFRAGLSLRERRHDARPTRSHHILYHPIVCRKKTVTALHPTQTNTEYKVHVCTFFMIDVITSDTGNFPLCCQAYWGGGWDTTLGLSSLDLSRSDPWDAELSHHNVTHHKCLQLQNLIKLQGGVWLIIDLKM